ncbi:MAG: hypothetical protein SV186_01205 [Candidatus Nanohaloarchaea archaeon]|nr:hypothetical protein [Candidatus Nanohaloarchaea archaeon]
MTNVGPGLVFGLMHLYGLPLVALPLAVATWLFREDLAGVRHVLRAFGVLALAGYLAAWLLGAVPVELGPAVAVFLLLYAGWPLAVAHWIAGRAGLAGSRGWVLAVQGWAVAHGLVLVAGVAGLPGPGSVPVVGATWYGAYAAMMTAVGVLGGALAVGMDWALGEDS